MSCIGREGYRVSFFQQTRFRADLKLHLAAENGNGFNDAKSMRLGSIGASRVKIRPKGLKRYARGCIRIMGFKAVVVFSKSRLILRLQHL